MNVFKWRRFEISSYPRGVSNHRQLDCLLNNLFRLKTNKTSKPRISESLWGESTHQGADGFTHKVIRKAFPCPSCKTIIHCCLVTPSESALAQIMAFCLSCWLFKLLLHLQGNNELNVKIVFSDTLSHILFSRPYQLFSYNTPKWCRCMAKSIVDIIQRDTYGRNAYVKRIKNNWIFMSIKIWNDFNKNKTVIQNHIYGDMNST